MFPPTGERICLLVCWEGRCPRSHKILPVLCRLMPSTGSCGCTGAGGWQTLHWGTTSYSAAKASCSTGIPSSPSCGWEGFVIPAIPLPPNKAVPKSAIIKAGQTQGKFFIFSQRFEKGILPQDPQTSTPGALHRQSWCTLIFGKYLPLEIWLAPFKYNQKYSGTWNSVHACASTLTWIPACGKRDCTPNLCLEPGTDTISAFPTSRIPSNKHILDAVNWFLTKTAFWMDSSLFDYMLIRTKDRSKRNKNFHPSTRRLVGLFYSQADPIWSVT